MAHGPTRKGTPPPGFLGNFSRRLGRRARPGEVQYIVGAYVFVTVVLLLGPFITTELPDQTGEKAPDFSLLTTNGGTFHLDPAHLAQPVLIEFMHPRCSHCQAMSERLASAHEAYGNQVEFVSVAIPLGTLGQPTMDDVRAFKDNYGHPWTYCLATDNDVAASYGVSGTPTWFFVTANGTIQSTQAGELPFEVLANSLQDLIGA